MTHNPNVYGYVFLSTLSLRRATSLVSDRLTPVSYFYPRSPCGERRARWCCLRYSPLFLSTLSLRRATRKVRAKSIDNIFLSTLSLRRATARFLEFWKAYPNFYPRSPCGERLGVIPDGHAGIKISIHALLAESDSKSAQNSGALLRI